MLQLISVYIINLPYFHFKHDVLITEKPLWGVFNKVLSYLILSYLILSYLILSYLILSYLILYRKYATRVPGVVSYEFYK